MDFADLADYVAHPRLTSLAVTRDGSRAVVAVQRPDQHGGKYLSSLWEIDPEGSAPARRLTFSERGESAPRFAPDGSLLFASARPDPESDDETAGVALWRLPEHGEARVVADAAAGVTLQGVADTGRILASTPVLAGGRLDRDGEARKQRRDRRISAIMHTGMPVRLWDHEVGDTATHLVTTALDDPDQSGERPGLTDLTPRVEWATLLYASADLSPDGTRVATGWSTRVKGGETRSSVALIDVDSGRRTVLLRATAAHSYGGPVFSPDGQRLAVSRMTASSPTDTSYGFLEIHSFGPDGLLADSDPVAVDVGDLTPSQYLWSADGSRLYVTGDLHSSGAVLEIDTATGKVRREVAADGVYSQVHVTDDGRYLFALRSSIDSPPAPVRIPLRGRGRTTTLPAPGNLDSLPGRLEWITTEVDGVEVGAWLCTPSGASASDPAPLMVWVHGGPHGSYNSWSWRWCPWLAVARGWAVLMPDPAMSTGYGHAGLNRGWPRRPDVVWAEVEALTDRALRRTTLDGERTALLGASFGGFMTNWIAGQSDRFGAIVTHAGLYALDQQHTTTDMAAFKVRVHRRPEEVPEWYAAYSPHHHASKITTPMLLVHGTKDYRVPISEALRMWWDLVSGFDGPPSKLPHRFLQFTGQNHWVLSPADSRVWNQAVLDFCDHHVRGLGDLPGQVPQW